LYRIGVVNGVALVVLLLLQEPVIEGARTLTGGLARSGCWLPVEVTVQAPPTGGFDGDVAVVGWPVTVIQAVRLSAGERRAIVVPALPVDDALTFDVELRVGDAVRAQRRLAERVTLVRGAERIVVRAPAGWRDAAAMYEAADAIEGEAWDPPARFGVVEPASAPLRVDEPWIAAKRDAAIFFVVAYVFAAVVVLLAAQRRGLGGAAMTVSMTALSAVFIAAFFAVFPRGRTVVHAWAIVADGREYRVHAWRGGPVSFASLAKPMFDSRRFPDRVVVRLDRGCTVTGATCAMTVEPAPAVGATKPAPAALPALRLLKSAFPEGAEILLLDEPEPDLRGVSAPGLVEARLAPRLVVRRR
jgi:hypothetical protein